MKKKNKYQQKALLSASIQRLLNSTTSSCRSGISNSLLHGSVTQNTLRELLLSFRKTCSSAAIDAMNLDITSHKLSFY